MPIPISQQNPQHQETKQLDLGDTLNRTILEGDHLSMNVIMASASAPCLAGSREVYGVHVMVLWR